MAKFNWGLICKRPIVDQRTGLPTLVDVVESMAFANDSEEVKSQLAAGEWIMIPVGVHCAFSISRTNDEIPESIEVSVSVVAPDGRIHRDRDASPLKLDMSTALKQRAFLLLEHFPYIIDGTYLIRVECIGAGVDPCHLDVPFDLSYVDDSGMPQVAKKASRTTLKKLAGKRK